MSPNDIPDGPEWPEDSPSVPDQHAADQQEPISSAPSDDKKSKEYSLPEEPFDAGACINWSWKAFTANVGTWIIVTIVFLMGVIIAWSLLGVLLKPVPEDTVAMPSIMFHAFIICIPVAIVIGFLGSFLTHGAQKETTPGQARVDLTGFLHPSRILTYGVSIASLIIISAGLLYLGSLVGAVGITVAILLVVGFTMSMLFLGPIIATTDTPLLSAVRQSFTLVMHHVGHVTLFFLMLLGVVILGVLTCGLGLLVSVPLVYLSTMFAYKRLTNQKIAAR